MTDGRPRLKTLIFEVTQQCNHACLHCYNVWHGSATRQTYPRYPRGELSTLETLALLSKALDETHCPHVTLSGGEPLLRQDLAQILDLLRGRQVKTTLISNGRLLTPERTVESSGRSRCPSGRKNRSLRENSGCTNNDDCEVAAMYDKRR